MVVAKLLLVLTSITAVGEDAQLLCFGAKWCQPCREMQPALDRLSREGFPIRKVDVDQHGELASRYQIKAVPACVLVDGRGRQIDQILQATDYDTLRRLFAHYRIAPTSTTIRGQSPGGESQLNPSASVPGDGLTMAGGRDQVQAKSMAATVRLRVEDSEGHSFGTGTIVDVHGQEGLVLTCGHIFRESKGKGRILIQRFDSKTAEPTTGSLVSYDIDRDVALVSMKLSRPIEVARLAPVKYQARRGEPVYSIGCNQGDAPTILQGQVNQVDKYLGPPNITASGRPVVGRSGGGLFNAEGELIGVCSAADPEIDEGLYAALPRVYYELDRNGLSFVYQNPQEQPVAEVASTAGVPNLQPPLTSETPAPKQFSPPPAAPVATSQFTAKRKTSELICVLKGEDGSDGKAYVIENPSDMLLEYLQREAKAAK